MELSAANLLYLHEIIGQRFKLLEGANMSTLESIAARPNTKQFGETPFPDIFSKAASILEAIIRWHPFSDGNKRTALLAVSVYLQANDYILFIPLNAVRFTVQIAKVKKTDAKTNRKLIAKISKWIRKYTAPKNDQKALSSASKKTIAEYRFLLYLAKSGIMRPIARAAVSRWLAFDIYPQYQAEVEDIIVFLQALISNSFNVAGLKLDDEFK